jgi:hypothetical protein
VFPTSALPRPLPESVSLSIMESLLTELATTGNNAVPYLLTRDLHRGWGRGQDALVLRIVKIIAERDVSTWVWV